MFINRIIQENIYQSFASPFVTTLLGPRRVGKSTLVQHFLDNHTEYCWVKFNLDDRALRDDLEQQKLRMLIQQAAKQHIGEKQKIWVAIDEAQKCPAIFEQIKIIYDEFKDQNVIKFILTGSGQLSLHQLSAESLAGRVHIFYLHEFSLRETIQLFNPQYTEKKSVLDKILGHEFTSGCGQKADEFLLWGKEARQVLNELLVFGGFPEVLQSESLDLKRQYLANYLQTYLEKDIRDLATISDIKLYKNIMRVIAEQTGSMRSDREIAESLQCSRDTLNKYRGFLAATLLYEEVYPFIGSSSRQLVKSPKGYLLNNGLISNLTGIDDLAVLEKAGLVGHRFENWFLNELKIRLSMQPSQSEINYWRARSGAEVDFVVRIGSGLVYPFEVTYARIPQSKKIKNLMTFMEQESQAEFGYYIYMGEFKVDLNKKIAFIPAWAV